MPMLATVLAVVLLSAMPPACSTAAYVSILGDPGMRARESSTALSGWNVCDGV